MKSKLGNKLNQLDIIFAIFVIYLFLKLQN